MKTTLFFLAWLFLFINIKSQISVNWTVNDSPDPSNGDYFYADISMVVTLSTICPVYMDISFPQGVSGASVVSWSGFDEKPKIFNIGDQIWHRNGNQIQAQYPLVSGVKSGGYSGNTLKMKLKLTANMSGNFKIYYRASLLCSGQTPQTNPYGNNGCATDQQGWRVYCENHTHGGQLPDIKADNLEFLDEYVYSGIPTNIKCTFKELNNIDINNSFKVALYDNEQKVATKTISSLAAGGNKSVTFSYTFSSIDLHQVKFIVDDENDIAESNENNNSQNSSLYVSVNNSPEVTIILVAPTSNSVTGNWVGTDPEGHNLEYRSWISGYDPSNWSSQTNTTYSNLSPGNYTFYVQVRESIGNNLLGNTDTKPFSIVLINYAPILQAIGAKTVNEGQLLEFYISATDPDGDELNYLAENLPLGASFSSSTRRFGWVPGYDQAGTYVVRFRVTDIHGLSDYEDVNITVNNISPNEVVQAWPQSNDTLNLIIPQDKSLELKVYIGPLQQINLLQFSFWPADGALNYYTLTVTPPTSVIQTYANKLNYSYYLNNPVVGWWTFKLTATNVTTGYIKAGIILNSSFGQAMPMVFFKPVVGLEGSLSIGSISWGLFTGVCSPDDYSCMGIDLGIGILPLAGNIKDVIQFAFSACIGAGYSVISFIKNDEASLQKAKQYFEASGWALLGISATLVGAYYVDEIGKSAKYTPEIAELMKRGRKFVFRGLLGDLPISAVHFREFSHLDIIHSTNTKPFLDRMADYRVLGLSGTNKGPYNENFVAAKFMSAPNHVYEAVKLYPEQVPGLNAGLFAKKLPNGEWDFSTSRFAHSIAGGEYSPITDADVIMKDQERGIYVIAMVKSSGNDYQSNVHQINNIKQAISKSNDDFIVNNLRDKTEVFGILIRSEEIHPLPDSPLNLTTDSSFIHNMNSSPAIIDSVVTNQHIKLYFHTNSEKNNAGFVVYRINPGDSLAFPVSGLIPGANNSSIPQYYSFIDQFAALNNIYRYFIQQNYISGEHVWTSDTIIVHYGITLVSQDEPTLGYNLSLAYPNPFNSITNITVEIPEQTLISLAVYNMLGEELSVLSAATYNSGQHNFIWNPINSPSGFYIIQLHTEKCLIRRKIMLLK